MNYKHLSLSLLIVASACAQQVPRRAQLPPLSGDDLLLPSSRTQGNSATSTNGWDYVDDNNAIKKICTGPMRNRNQSLCKELEQFHQAIQQAGVKAKAELRASEQMGRQGTLRMDEVGDVVSIVGDGMTIAPRPELIEAIQKILDTKQVTQEDFGEAMSLAPLLMFAQNAGSTRMEQKIIAGIFIAQMLIVQELMAQQQQQTMPGRFPRG